MKFELWFILNKFEQCNGGATEELSYYVNSQIVTLFNKRDDTLILNSDLLYRMG